MKTRPLGNSGIEASIIGLGTWPMGGWMWGGCDKEESIRAIHRALDIGMNLLDTAPIYGFGVSESVVGEAIQDRREKAIVATKCGMICDTAKGEEKFFSDAQGPTENGHIGIRLYNNPRSIKAEVEASLKRLRTDYIDLYQTHWQESATPIEDTMGALLELKEEGKIRAIGVSNATPEQMDAYRKVGMLDSDQEPFSMLRQKTRDVQLRYCHTNGLALLAYSPLMQGLLTGKMTADRDFEEGDQRKGKKLFSVENRKTINAMLDRFKPIAEKHSVSLAQLTLAWTFHQEGCSHVLAGARRVRQVEENAVAGDVSLSAEELHAMEQALAEYLPRINE